MILIRGLMGFCVAAIITLIFMIIGGVITTVNFHSDWGQWVPLAVVGLVAWHIFRDAAKQRQAQGQAAYSETQAAERARIEQHEQHIREEAVQEYRHQLEAEALTRGVDLPPGHGLDTGNWSVN